MKSRLLLLVLLATTAPAMAAQQVYSWVDANGTKHFSDSPPPASVTKAQKLKVQGQLTTAAADESAAPKDDAAKDETGKSNGPALAAAAGYAPDDIKRNCEIARKNLSIIEAQVVSTDPQGNPLDPEQAKSHGAQLDKANQQIKLFCTGT